MLLPLIWLNDYLKVDLTPPEIAERLTRAGHMLDGPIENQVLSLEIRQNRPDCLSILGLVREVAALTKTTIKEPKIIKIKLEKDTVKLLEVKDPDLVRRFAAVKIAGVKINQSPDWIKERLLAYGLEPINNIVDITNFVMIELGQPMHAFDAELIAGGKLIVRRAQKGEKFTSLDGSTYPLDGEDLVIADKNGVTALAGVIGGQNSQISPQTTTIILEAANYDNISIRRSSRRHNIRTEASTRLEKFLDPRLAELAIQRALDLINQAGRGEVAAGEDYYLQPTQPTKIIFPYAEVTRYGGAELKSSQIEAILKSLSFTLKKIGAGKAEVTAPYWRTDITQPVDLVEEVLRIYGYDQITSQPLDLAPPKEITPPTYLFKDKLRDILVRLGLDEHITEPLVKYHGTQAIDGGEQIKLDNPLNTERDGLRTSIEETLRPVLTTYRKYKLPVRGIFEIGKIYSHTEDDYSEAEYLGVVFPPETDYRVVKGVLEKLFAELGVPKVTTTAAGFIQTELGGLKGIKKDSFRLNLETLYQVSEDYAAYFQTEAPKAISEDISFLIDEKTNLGPIITDLECIDTLVRGVELREVLSDQKFAQGQKSVHLRISFAHPDNRNLSKTEVEPIRQKIIKRLGEKYQAKVRK